MKVDDYIGMRFGRLKVIENVGYRTSPSGSRHAVVKCLCDCGSIISTTTELLNSGRKKSCGCFRKEVARETHSKKNTYRIEDDIAIGITDNGIEFLIDSADVDILKDLYVSCSKGRYPMIRKNGVRTRLHRFLLNVDNDKVVDHINGDPLDNRRCNLRITTQAKNCLNHKKAKNNTSGSTGVYWDSTTNSWKAEIRIDGKYMNLGRFRDKDKAIEARKNAEDKYFGEFKRDVCAENSGGDE